MSTQFGHMPPLLELKGLTKRFGSFTANDGIDMIIAPGAIHAVLGENGAGKSTLMKMIYGVLQPDEGDILWNGRPIELRNPAHARETGIGMVFQHFSLFESMTVVENIAMAVPKPLTELRQMIREKGKAAGLEVDPDAIVHSLPMGLRQRVEIIRCLLVEPKLIILDEPTSVLPPSAVPALFDTIRRLAEAGCAVLFISHKLEEIRSLCHSATVIQRGRVTAHVDPAAISAHDLAALMIGREIPHPDHPPRKPEGPPALTIRNLSYQPVDPLDQALSDISFEVRPGEIVGIAGISGNGQTQLAKVLSGELALPRGSREVISMLGQDVSHADPWVRRRAGLAYVSEDRNNVASVPELSLEKNALLTASEHGLRRRWSVDWARTRAFTQACIEAMDVRCQSPASEARELSGGNLQKFIVAREIALKPKVLIVAQPTWGVDAGAAFTIRQELIRLRDEGVAILVISEELEELFEIADRFLVMFRGRLSEPLSRDLATEATIGAMMAGDFAAIPQAREVSA